MKKVKALSKSINAKKRAEQLHGEILDLVRQYAELAHAPTPFEPGASPVPVSGRVYGAEELVSLVDSSLEFWLTSGRFNSSFEAGLAAFLGRKQVLTVNSGSSANLIALGALTSHLMRERALKPGDEVITCAAGFPTTVNPILLYGLVPVFVDVSLPTYNIDVAALEEAVSERTCAIMVAHTLGNPFDLDAVMAFAQRHDLWVIEDSCDALGATYGDRKVGSFGDIGTLSFYPAHHITTGEGGAVFTDQPAIRRALESLRDWGRDCYCAPGDENTCGQRFEWQLGELPMGYDHKYIYSHLGFNLKITDMQAAIGLAQLDRLDGFIAARRANFGWLYDGLKPLEDVLLLPEATDGSNPSWFGFPITVRDDASFTRDALVRRLNANRIGTRYLFGGNLVRQPYMSGRNFRTVGGLANAQTVLERTFWIGVYPGLGEAHIGHVLDVFNGFAGDKRKAG